MKKILLSVILVAMSLCYFACGGSPDEKENGVTTISFFGWGSEEEQRNFQYLINQFMKDNEDIKVTYSATPSSSYMTTLNNKSNNLPDVFYMPDYEFTAWAAEGKLLALDDYISQDELASVWDLSTNMYRFNDNTLQLGNGTLYGLPKDLGPFTLVYNKTLINKIKSEKNLDIQFPSSENPMTFTQFANYLSQLKYTDENNKKIYGISHYELNAAVYSNNANFWTDDLKNSKIKDKNFQDAIQFIADLALVYDVMPSADNQASISGFDRFLSGGCLFTFMGPWDLKSFWETVDFDYDLCPVPVGEAEGAKSTTWIGSVAYAVSAKTKKKEAALRLIKWLTFNENAQKSGYQIGQAMPNIISMAKGDFINGEGLSEEKLKPANRSVWVNIVDGKGMYAGKNRANYYLYDNSCYDELLSNLEDIYTGRKTAKEVLDKYNDTFQKGLNENNAYYN